jgi:membrane protease YdiL (CAAX protease family)
MEVILADLTTHGAAILYAVTILGLALVTAGGAWRPRRVLGPDRTEPFQSWLQLLAILFFGFFAYMLVVSAYAKYVNLGATRTDSDFAFLTTIPPLIGFALILAGDAALGGRAGVRALGEDPADIPRGVMFGVIGALIAIPLVMWTSVLTEAVYEHWHYSHPMEHELLPAMKEGPIWARRAIMFGAIAAAPLFEEILFRGHLQTLLRSAFIRLSAMLNESPAAPPRGPRIRPWHSWLAIVLASAAFAGVHPLWMQPPIFVLALCMGYAYERTGLLWTTITMHALFNATETFLSFHVH